MKNAKLSKYKTIQAACCIQGKRVLFASLPDSLINTDYELTYVFSYDAALAMQRLGGGTTMTGKWFLFATTA